MSFSGGTVPQRVFTLKTTNGFTPINEGKGDAPIFTIINPKVSCIRVVRSWNEHVGIDILVESRDAFKKDKTTLEVVAPYQ